MSKDTRTPPDYSAMGRRSVQSRRLAAIEKRIQELVAAAPPLTPEQVKRLDVALRGAS